ncbi:MAG: glycerate kinase [Xenococcus sp. (in: cyanobacteria)]
MQKLDLTTTSILLNWVHGKQPQEIELEELIKKELADQLKAQAFRIDKYNSQQLIEARAQLFCSAYSNVLEWCDLHGVKDQGNNILSLMWNLWLPIAVNLAELRQQLGRTPIQGILGGQGTGKSFLASILRLLLSHLGYTTVNLSLDDIYKTHTERFKLQKTDPRLIWRGPPGTHDIYLGLRVLENCLQKNSFEQILIPRFDKSAHNGEGDRGKPEAITQADIVLFEGWFVGVRPIEETIFDNPLPPITSKQDIRFAKDNNERLKAYVPLWEKLDSLFVLYPLDYRFSKQWRKEAEHKMIATGKTGMSDQDIENFVDYFWRALHPELFIDPLCKRADLVDLVIEIEENHNYSKIYKPN